MNKAAKIVYCALFFAVCATPLALMPFVESNAEIEKKALTEMPAFISEGKINTNFSEQFESWFNDRLPLRSQLLSAANLVKSELLTSPSSNVITGSDGYIFFDTDKLDYMNTNAMTDSQIKAMAVTLSLIQENVKAKNGSFTFVPMPNKASVYDDKFPACYKKAEENNLSRLTKQLDELGVNYVDMLSLMNSHKEEGIYHKRDSHWNYLGALYGYDAIMNSLGKAHKTYNGVTYDLVKDWRGDLDKLLYPSGGFMDYQYRLNIDYQPFRFTAPVGVTDTQAQLEIFMSDKEENDNRIGTANMGEVDNTRLYMVRDSFGRALLPFFIDNYKNAMFVRTDCPELSMVAEGGDMVYEIVERNLKNLINTAPFMFGPEREGISAEGLSDGGSIETVASDEGYAIRVYGALPDDADMGNGRVYVKLSKDGEEHTFEAFPIYEKKFLGENGTNGFSLMIDPSLGLSGTYKTTVICGGTVRSGSDAVIEAKQ
ncbi:MAG: hypothetical protein IKN17_07680 [Ruminococcus sp.]|nr:hypothetical protein [Ruminococcus sp.]